MQEYEIQLERRIDRYDTEDTKEELLEEIIEWKVKNEHISSKNTRDYTDEMRAIKKTNLTSS